MNKKIGIIGFGEMGKRHALEFFESTEGMIKTEAVVEPNDVRYQQGCEWSNCQPERFASPEEMLKKCDLDGLVISSPNSCHLDDLKSLKGKKIPVLLEKPLDTNIDKICEIVRFACDYQGPIVVDHAMRHAPIVRKAKALITEGQLGKICSFNFVQHHPGGPMFHTFRRSLKGGGGHLVEKATHDLDVLLFLTDALPKRVAAISKQQFYGGDKAEDLHCADCRERLCCNSVTGGRTEDFQVKDINTSNDLCAFSSAVDVADNETCLIELENNIFGTYSQCYFVRGARTREYEIIGTQGIMRISFTGNPDGKITFYPRDYHTGELHYFNYSYKGKIHYNAGRFAALHFNEVMCGNSEPFTTVNQAFVAEMLACAAMKAADENCFIDVVEFIPEDMRKIYCSTY